MKKNPRTVLLLGSGALKIGEAGEFDYSGSQAIKALKEEGIRVILVNPNIATIQTSEDLADEVYFLPVNPDFVTQVIEKERPEGILLSFGGQTALNCGLELERRGVFKKFNVEVLGTEPRTIQLTEDRQAFADELRKIGMLTPRSEAATSVEGAQRVASEIGFPVMVRAAFTLGGKGSGVARDEPTLIDMVKKALMAAPQVLIEEYLDGWKEIEYEVVRDAFDNCITVCNMENFDALGIHTGESIVVAPSQTLTDKEYHRLRSISIKLIRHLKVVGECNVQFAFHPEANDYRIIEVNARLSRSSALASKATGYPLAHVAAKLGLGYSLAELKNAINGRTTACFEPALDYVVVKIPRWDLKKFRGVSDRLGSEMKSVGEIMAIGRNFEEALQKGIRMLHIGADGVDEGRWQGTDEELTEELRSPTQYRVFALARAFSIGWSLDKVHQLSKISHWFLCRLKAIVEADHGVSGRALADLDEATMRELKRLGFADEQLGRLLGDVNGKNAAERAMQVRRARVAMGIMPSIKQIDTLAAEYPATTNYLYLTFDGDGDDVETCTGSPYLVLGGGPYRIGSSVEFDWCCVSAAKTLERLGKKTIILNNNPETVSTDYDTADRLYFDELSLETVLDIAAKEDIAGVFISMGGQIPNNLAVTLQAEGLHVVGTSPDSIDGAENRQRFSSLLDRLGIAQPQWQEATSIDEARRFANDVGYPVLIRPSYVLSGAAMSVAHSDDELATYLQAAAEVSPEYPVVLSKFIKNARELELDGVADGGEIVRFAMSEHVENAGVHSGDATLVFPPQRVYLETIRQVRNAGRKIARELNITGPFNIQFVARDNAVQVIECNLRASRSFPFVSKLIRENLIEVAVEAMLGKRPEKKPDSTFELDHVGVKAPQFSFSRLKGADPLLGVEMASTGEVGCIGDDVHEAYLKAMIAVGFHAPKKGVLLSTGTIDGKVSFLENAKKLNTQGLPLYATQGTHDFLSENGVSSTLVAWPGEGSDVPDACARIAAGDVDFVVNVPKNFDPDELNNDYLIRRAAVDYEVNLLTNIQAANLFVEACARHPDGAGLMVKPWSSYAH